MPIPSMFAIYFLFFFLCLFVVLPFEFRSSDDAGQHVRGQMHGAPAHFNLPRAAVKTGLIAFVPTILFILNYRYDWITRDLFDGTLHWLGAPDRPA